MAFRIDPTGEPRTIDLVQKGPNAKDSIDKGIYKLDRDTLTVCTAQVGNRFDDTKARPKELKSTEGVLRVFKRVEKKHEPVRIEARTRDGKAYELAGRDAILECVMNKKLEGLVRLVKEGHDITEPYQKDGSWTFLHLAVSHGNIKAAEALITAGADVNASFNGGPTPLKLAAERGGRTIVELLQKHGAK